MNKLKSILLAGFVVILAFTGCQVSHNPKSGGNLTVSMNDEVSRSILPALSMVPASYELIGDGPNEETFIQSVLTGSSVIISDLVIGEWTVTVTAKNSDGTAIGQGNGTVTVLSNASVSLSITVKPYDGVGSLSLNITWPATQVQTADIESTLTPYSGAVRDLSFTVNTSTGTASFTASDVATGYHTLTLKLLDNEHVAIGAVEVIRIIKDQITNGTLAFTELNKATGSLAVNMTPDMGLPLEASITGSASTKPENQSLTLTATVANYNENVTYVWYVNGTAVSTGAGYSFADSWELGYYRIDVTAFSADGKRAGSATANVQVVEAVASNNNYTSANIGNLVYVPAGSFQRDATATNISVITQPYRMSATEITRAQFQTVMGSDPSDATYSSGTSDPVQMISWYHAIAFCNKLSLAEGLTPVYAVSGVEFGTLLFSSIPTTSNADWDAATATWTNNGYRLPTEMEWMWAAMGATSDRSNGYTGSVVNTTGYAKPFAGSTGSNAIGDYAVYGYSGTETGRTITANSNSVGSKLANELGLFDMSGNVREWCWDWHETALVGTQIDYRGPSAGMYHVFHGGGWAGNASTSAVAGRGANTPYSISYLIGFRVVRP